MMHRVASHSRVVLLPLGVRPTRWLTRSTVHDSEHRLLAESRLFGMRLYRPDGEQDCRSRAENLAGLGRLERRIKHGHPKAPICADKGLFGVRRIDDGRCPQRAPSELWPG